MSDEAGVSSITPDDPSYRAAVTDLLGLLSLGELIAFEHLAADAGLAPSLADKAALAAMAVAEFQQIPFIVLRHLHHRAPLGRASSRMTVQATGS